MFDQVKDKLLREGSINSLSCEFIKKTLMLGVNLEPPNFFEILLMALNHPPPPPSPQPPTNTISKSLV